MTEVLYSLKTLDKVNQSLEEKTPQDILRWAINEFYPDITLACSFGGVSGMALLDMVMKLNPKVRVFYLDTGLLFPETYALAEEAAQKYGFCPVAFRSALTISEQAERYGEALWARDPDLCCQLRKVEPNRQALEGQRAWISGVRRDQAETRRSIKAVEWDDKFGLAKVSPLVGWTEKDVWKYIVENNVPYNPLHDGGYPSIGCVPCTRPVALGDDPRSGRWQGFDKTECGLHT